ncbi:MAG: hypothetical protein ACE5HE_02750, partial [Phycisphaerae bacterium]
PNIITQKTREGREYAIRSVSLDSALVNAAYQFLSSLISGPNAIGVPFIAFYRCFAPELIQSFLRLPDPTSKRRAPTGLSVLRQHILDDDEPGGRT